MITLGLLRLLTDGSLPDVWLDPEEKVQAEECGHHDDVAGDANEVAHFVSRKEEFVHQPGKQKFDFEHSTFLLP